MGKNKKILIGFNRHALLVTETGLHKIDCTGEQNHVKRYNQFQGIVLKFQVYPEQLDFNHNE